LLKAPVEELFDASRRQVAGLYQPAVTMQHDSCQKDSLVSKNHSMQRDEDLVRDLLSRILSQWRIFQAKKCQRLSLNTHSRE
jgi:hypothetical protein